jgi:hypothetical protein
MTNAYWREIMQVQELVLNWVSGRKKCWQLTTGLTAASVVLRPEAALRLFRNNPVNGVSKHIWHFGQCQFTRKQPSSNLKMITIVSGWGKGRSG